MENIENLLSTNSDWPPLYKQSFIFTEFDFEDGRVGYKIEKCRWAEVLSELNEPDYAYAIACHYDFIATMCMNNNFILTRNQTLTKNKDYCDFCWHDKRMTNQINHPDKDFWDKLGSLL